MHLPRTLSDTIREASQRFRVLLLTGPRQVGKTTLLQSLEPETRHYVTLDSLNARAAARKDPMGFIEQLPLPVFIDEIQYAPELLSAIKMVVDKLQQPGLFWLTGSQQFEMMKNVSESLAGRVVILKMQGLSCAEEQQRDHDAPFLPTTDCLKERRLHAQPLKINDAYHRIWRGTFPEILKHTDPVQWEQYYESYITTFVQRDIRDYLDIKDTAIFLKFTQIAAARTGQLLNYRDVATDVGVSEATIKTWLNALQASGIIHLLQPYFNNHNKRLIKTPKLYFMDTGLCCYLTGWMNADVLKRGAMNGAMLETYVITEIIKSYIHHGRKPPIYFYRDKDKREIDLLIQHNDVLHPVEIKKTATLQPNHAKVFDILKKETMQVGHGAIICFADTLTPISRDVDAVPVGSI